MTDDSTVVTVPPVLAYDPDRVNNAQLIEDVAALGHLQPGWSTWDVTYGRGAFWSNWRPEQLRTSDIDPEVKGEVVDFTDLPADDRTVDVVVFDPPYKLCLDGATEVLTRNGWLSWDEVEVGDFAYSLNHDTGEGEWRRIEAVHVYPKSTTAVRVCEGKNLDFVATPDHRWPVLSSKGRRRWKTTERLAAGDRVIHAARWSGLPAEAVHDDAFVELVAWFWTEGHIKAGSTYGVIAQSHVVNPNNCARIAACLEKLYGPAVDHFPRTGRTSELSWRIVDEERIRRFVFSAAVGADLLAVAPFGTSTVRSRGGPTPTLEFLESLTAEQLELFITASLDADGSSAERLGQRDECMADAFAVACLLSGRAISLRWFDGTGHTVTIKRCHHSKPSRPGVSVDDRDVVMWCPTVEGTGTWLARRNGTVYFTGNSGTPDLGEFDERYGIEEYSDWRARMWLIEDGLRECLRVARHRVLLKCQDQVVSGKKVWQTIEFTKIAEQEGWRLVDQLHVAGYRPQPGGRTQVHARQAFSTLLVFVPEPRVRWERFD